VEVGEGIQYYVNGIDRYGEPLVNYALVHVDEYDIPWVWGLYQIKNDQKAVLYSAGPEHEVPNV